eukprot:TRINITY_DN23685_c0_g1_i1.p1 TRINITY_DN23685_c0_g1~~TRINITY_DN23685_c0_g1_i1.p1  ORF type:complete len:296 (+),score=18.18 TRINITY_DN23685_c0_g1_i1:83-889(+)
MAAMMVRANVVTSSPATLLGNPFSPQMTETCRFSRSIGISAGRRQHSFNRLLNSAYLQPRVDLQRTALRGHSVSCRSSSSPMAETSTRVGSSDTATELVDRILALAADNDSGAAASDATKSEVERLAAELEAMGLEEPLKSPLIFGDWAVVFTSNPTAAGGYYRSLLGRTLLKTKEMVQTIAAPNRVGNRVTFDALNFVPGKVTLEGAFTAKDNKWVDVEFEPPTFLLGSVNFKYGGNSRVQLATTYLDERIRLGRGSRGSLFVFRRM